MYGLYKYVVLVLTQGGPFRVPRRGSVWRREDGERDMSKSTGRSERVESS